MTKRAVALVASSLGLGGTEKGLVTHALHIDRERFDLRVVTWNAEGERRLALEANGVPVMCAYGDFDRLSSLLHGVDLAHLFRHGGAEPMPVQACKRAGVSVLIDENNLGAVDHSADEPLFACHLFILADVPAPL